MSGAAETSQAPRRRGTLAVRISVLSVAIAVITAVIAGTLAIGLIRNAGAGAARKNLARVADVAQAVAVRNNATTQRRLRTALAGLNVRGGVILRDGTLTPRTVALVRQTVDARIVQQVLAGEDVSTTRNVDSTTVFVEARTTPRGGIVLVQRQVDATAANRQAIRRLLLALLVAGGLAAILGLLVAWRLARPLRRTAAAAHSLATGNRDVRLPAQGPAEVVEVSEAVNTLAEALRHSEGRQREFLLSVSHDLRTPLTAITGYAESLAEGVVPPADTAHVGAVMLGESQRLNRLVGDLLDLARLDAQDFRIDLAPVDLTALVHGAAGVWSTRCAASGVRFHLQAMPSPLWVTTDAARVRQVLDGLFDNALRVTPAGAPIVLAASAEPGVAVVEVRDGGPGLSPDDLTVAFEQGALYERYRGVRRVGTGLGLAIVHGLTTRLGGRVEAGHAAEGGARFTVRLPVG
ncbi:ATP-binding protein [uncultured Jatrophihabitans sp.]|uniref:HAMP domain-containing sensor histidine kinase n=1 Tax=uncultured Jatrophihabitans sp. TaxID=1610747 RepID=UPI0035CB54D3